MKSSVEASIPASVTLSQEQLVENVLSQIAERFEAREPNVQEKGKAIRENLKHDFPRLADKDGVFIQAERTLVTDTLREALNKASEYTGYAYKEDPGATSIKNHDLVFIEVSENEVGKDAKRFCQRLDNQLKAIDSSGAIGVIALLEVNGWSNATNSKVLNVLNKHKSPRVLLNAQQDAEESPAWTAKMLKLVVGAENTLLAH